MRYLTLAADYTGAALRDDFPDVKDPEPFELPPELWAALKDWNRRYGPIIFLDPLERAEPTNADLIRHLDAEGKDLAGTVVRELGNVKVRYYSEGLLRYVD